MRDYNFPSEICEYCVCTDFGDYPICTTPYNLCEGSECENAYINWQEEHPEDKRELDEMF